MDYIRGGSTSDDGISARESGSDGERNLSQDIRYRGGLREQDRDRSRIPGVPQRSVVDESAGSEGDGDGRNIFEVNNDNSPQPTSEMNPPSSAAFENNASQNNDNVNDDMRSGGENDTTKAQSVDSFKKLTSDIRKGEDVSLQTMRDAVDALILNHGEAVKAELSQLKKQLNIFEQG